MKKEYIEEFELCEQELMLLHNRLLIIGNDLESDKNKSASNCFDLCGLLKEIQEGIIKIKES